MDHLRSTECFRHSGLKYLVLDEVDRLLDMGFEKQVKDILVRVGGKTYLCLRQTLHCSR